jgi:hypothetical protein
MGKQYYAVSNRYGSSCSQGYSDTWYGLAFSDKKARDDYVSENEYKNLAVRACKKANLGKYLEKPKPFSYTRRAINPYCDGFNEIVGCIGIIEIMNINEGYKL